FPVAHLARWFIERRVGEPLAGVEPISCVANISPRPIFVIAAGRGAVVGSEETRRLFDAAREPKRFWLIPEANHARCWQEAGEVYERRVVEFFNETLGA